MAFDLEQTEWLQGFSGLAVAKERADTKRSQKEVLAAERTLKLGPAKDSIKKKLQAASYKNGVFSSVKVLDEKGGQQAEFDYSDLKADKAFNEQYLASMHQAMEQLAAVTEEMRAATTELIDEKTGSVVKDEKGNPVMVPLYTDEQIIEEVYLPLVRERVMPEWLVPDRFSKTQQMLDATDALYKDRLREYTAQLDEEDQSLLDAGKDGITQLGGLAQKALAMVPGAEAETASAIVGLTVLGATSSLTVVGVLTKGQIDKSLSEVISNVGEIVAKSVALGTGDDDIGELAGNLFKAAVTGAKMGICLAQDPPDVAGAIGEFADGLESALSAAFSGKDLGGADPSLVSEAASKSAVLLFKSIASGIRIAEHVENGDSDAIIAELTAASQETLKTVQSIVTTAITEGRKGDAKKAIEEQQQALTDRISEGIDLAAAGISVGKKIVDAVLVRNLRGMADDIVNGIGDVLNGVLGMAAPEVASDVGNAYRTATKVGLLAYYVTMDPPDKRQALQCLADGFESAFALAGSDENPELATVGSAISTAFVSAGSSIDLATALAAGRYNDASKALSKLARTILSRALQQEAGDDPEATSDGSAGDDLLEGAEAGMEGLKELTSTVAKALEGLNDEKAKAKLREKLDELRTADALADIESSKEEVERMLIQGDEGGGKAADTRSIQLLIQQMQRDRLIMEMAFKLVSAGAAIVEQFVAPMAIGGAAIKLAANLVKASQRAMTLNTWVNNQKDMHKAVSSFESSAANFVKNQAEQFSHYAIKAALELARMIGEIISCTGMASAAGVAIAKGAALGLVAEEISYKFYKKADLENAWRITKKAWANPQSRKLGLLARKLNPTLAKYTLAWGASVKRDALCQEAMRTCGLNALTLSQKDSNVNQVQRYLEVCFNEDNVVLKRFTEADWMPPVELTAKSWATAKSRGEKEGKVTVADAPGLDEALVRLGELQTAFDAAVAQITEVGYVQGEIRGFYAELEPARERYEAASEHVLTLFRAYQPTNEKGYPHPEMCELRDEFKLVAEEAAASNDATWQELVDKLEDVRPPPDLAALFEDEKATV